MSNNKQSSIEQLESDLKMWFDFVRISFPTEIENAIKKAKAKHELEIIQSMGDMLYKINQNALLTEDVEWCKQKYNETFGGNNEQQ